MQCNGVGVGGLIEHIVLRDLFTVAVAVDVDVGHLLPDWAPIAALVRPVPYQLRPTLHPE